MRWTLCAVSQTYYMLTKFNVSYVGNSWRTLSKAMVPAHVRWLLIATCSSRAGSVASVGNCDSDCTLAATSSCRSRYTWLLDNAHEPAQCDAILRVNGECRGQCACDAAAACPSNPLDANAYTLVWADEFEGVALDATRWEHSLISGLQTGNDELQHYTDAASNAYVSGGTLKIAAKREDHKGYGYSSARLSPRSQRGVRYGRVEVMHTSLPARA